MPNFPLGLLAVLQSIVLGLQPQPIDIGLSDPGALKEGLVQIQGEVWVACYLADPEILIIEAPPWLGNTSIVATEQSDDCLKNATRSHRFVVEGNVNSLAPAFHAEPLSVEARSVGPSRTEADQARIAIQPSYFGRVMITPREWTSEPPRVLDLNLEITANGATTVRFESPDVPRGVMLPIGPTAAPGVTAAVSTIRLQGMCPAEGFNLRAVPVHVPSGALGSETLVLVPPCEQQKDLGVPVLAALTCAALVAAALRVRRP